MSKEKKWEILNKESNNEAKKVSQDEIVDIILKNRGLKTKKDIDAFLHADLSFVSPKTVGIEAKQLAKSLQRIKKAVDKKEQMVIYGDYDVDGITGTAILWETLHALTTKVAPYIPGRIEEGYGLSIKGIENLLATFPETKLIITVDNGIVANEAVDFANKKGIDVIITDHHTIGKKLPDAYSIVHTTAICGAAVGWILSQEINSVILSDNEGSKKDSSPSVQNDKNNSSRLSLQDRHSNNKIPEDHLSLVALATVADLVPLTGANRILLRFGLESLHRTNRPGLIALFEEAGIEKEKIGVYEIGHIIGPRLNAMGRLESAMDSLRLLCTHDRMRAKVLADTVSRTNRERQLLTQSAATHAIEQFRLTKNKKILFIAHEDYEEGIIGLVAGKLVEEYYLPAIVLSKGKKVSKASARSISGFNIIEFIRTSTDLLINAGGHPMAAGFTIETAKIIDLQKKLENLAEEQLNRDILQRILKVDTEIPLRCVTPELYKALQKLSPFGMGNPEPTFVSLGVIKEIKTVGKEKQHLKLKVSGEELSYEAIAFGQGEKARTLKIGGKIQIVYTISENEWQGKKSLQIKIRDIKL